MTDTAPEREKPPRMWTAQKMYPPVATQIRLDATAQGFLYSLCFRLVHHAPANIRATIPSMQAELMFCNDVDFASVSPPEINIKMDCSAKKLRTRFRSILI